MITLNVGENNPITPDFYNNLIANLQLHRLICPCGHSGCLFIHGYYYRYVKTPAGKVPFRICRVYCSCCGHTHAILLSSMVPYSQTSLPDHAAIISAFESGRPADEIMDKNPTLDEGNLRYIISQYLKYWKQRLLVFKFPFNKYLVSNCFAGYSRQFMQIKSTPNILFISTT